MGWSLDGVPLPQVTLGWLAAEWISTYCSHGPGDYHGQPLVLLDDAVHHLLHAYSYVHDAPGCDDDQCRTGGHWRRRYNEAVYGRPKGVGKTPLEAAKSWFETLGPCRLDGFNADGQPVGRPVTSPFVRVLATELTQSKATTYAAIRSMGEHDRMGAFHGLLDIGKTRIELTDGSGAEIRPSTAGSVSKDGGREPLALTTPVPTAGGWKRLGDVAAGDEVFGIHGERVPVLGRTRTFHDKPCFRVTFDDGTSVVATDRHRWVVNDKNAHAGKVHPRVTIDRDSTRHASWYECDTSYLADAFSHDAESVARRFRLRPDGPWDYIGGEDLPVDPYVLGRWLGDGDTARPMITVANGEAEWLEHELRRLGYDELTIHQTHCVRIYIKNARSMFAALGVLGDKHIPDVYMRAVTRDRLALLQGLVDSDGWVGPRGNASFWQATGRLRLLRQAATIIRSLGWRVATPVTAAKRGQGGYGINFTPTGDVGNPARQPNKASHYRHRPAMWRRIVGVDPVDSVPTACIMVDSEDHEFLAGDGGLPTGNTYIAVEEGHHYVTPELREMYHIARQNLPKRRLADPWMGHATTAYALNAGSVIEDLHADRFDPDLLWDWKQGPAPNELDWTDADEIRGHLRFVYDGVDHVDVERLVRHAMKASTDRPRFCRYYLNRPSTLSDRWLRSDDYDACPTVDQFSVGDAVAVGFDGSLGTDQDDYIADSTAMVACRISDGALMVLGVWEHRTKGPWKPPRELIRQVFRDVVDRYQVVRIYADPKGWETDLAEMAAEFARVKVAEWHTSSQRSRQNSAAIRSLEVEIAERRQPFVAHPALREHMLNAVKNTSNVGGDEQYRLAKPSDAAKIDLAVTAYLAREARNDAFKAGEGRPRKRAGSFVAVGRR